MSRQVDVKALVSHVIRGDGVNKCRICMGDTSEGQVYLSDTVLMEGDKPVTLSELLEVVTGIQVLLETELPGGLCSDCTNSALNVWHFKALCSNSDKKWRVATTILNKNIGSLTPCAEDKMFYISFNKEGVVFSGGGAKTDNLAETADRLNNIIRSDRKRERKKQKNPNQSKFLYQNKCYICGKVFSLPQYLSQHLANMAKGACTVCGKIVPRQGLPKHLGNVHGKFVHHCKVCHQYFEDQSSLDNHKELHKFNLPQCSICKYGFRSERSLRAHMYSHTLFNCTNCNKGFENRKCFVYHKEHCTVAKQYNEVEGIYECDICGKTYTKKPSLRIHIIQKHLNVLPYICMICGKRSATKNHHKSHELIHTKERKIYQCYCGAKLRSSLGYHMHQRIHSGEKPYKCDDCGDRFLSASRRLDHIKRRHKIGGAVHKCEKCAVSFIRPYELRKHYIAAHFENV